MSSRSNSSISNERHCSTAKEAVQYRNVLELQRIVQQGENINATDSKYAFSLLHWAAHYGSLECMHWLLWHGAEINKQSKDEWTPAHIAAIRGRSACMQALTANGANINLVDSRGKSPTHLATSHGNTKTLQEILRKGISIEVRDNVGWTPAHTAAYHGKIACLQLLCKWGCDVNALDLNGNTLAHLAASEGHTNCLKFLLSQTRNVKGLVKARNDQGDTPKDCALQYYKKSSVDYLQAIEYDVDNPEVSDNLAYPAHNSAYKGDLEYLQMVIETGVASIDERDDKGSTPLHKASGNGQTEIVKWLIENGADTRLLNAAGETAKEVAFRFAQLSCAKLLGGQSDYEEDDHAADVNNIDVQNLESDAKVRAERKLEELNEQLEIAKLNFRQLGGTLNEDRRKVEEQKEHSRIIRKLEDQLEYERVKREKLEEQVDQMRVHIHKLHLQLEEEQRRMDEVNFNVDSKLSSTKEKKPPRRSPGTNKVKKSQYNSQSQSGIFLVQKKNKPATNENSPTNNNYNNNNRQQQKKRIPKPPNTEKPNNNFKQQHFHRRDSSPESSWTHPHPHPHPALVSPKSAVSMVSMHDAGRGEEEKNLSISSDVTNDELLNESLENPKKIGSGKRHSTLSNNTEQEPTGKSPNGRARKSSNSSNHSNSSSNDSKAEDDKSLFKRFKDDVVSKVTSATKPLRRKESASSQSSGSNSDRE